MTINEYSSEKPSSYSAYNNLNGTTTIYLRKNIEQVYIERPGEDSSEQAWRCDTVSGTYMNGFAPTESEVSADFDSFWNELDPDYEEPEPISVDPQLQAVALMQVSLMNLEETSSSDVVKFREYWPEWTPDTVYGFQQPLRYNGLYYRTSKALTSSSVYPPDMAGESEYYPIEIAPDGIIVYRECHGLYDSVQKGETRHYPDENSPIYRSLVDKNSYAPDVVPANWELV